MKIILLAFAIMLMASCSSAPPTIQEGPDAEVSFDGLHKINNSAFREAWADPDIDFSRYTKILPGNAFFEYRAVKKSSGTYRSRPGDTEFYIDDAGREALAKMTNEIFGEEVAKSTRFTVTDERGPDVIVVRGGLHDIVSKVPPDLVGRGDIYLSSVGEITLVLEVVDSMSGEVIARAVERRALDQTTGTGMAMPSSTVHTRSEVRRVLRRWATKLRDGLDGLPTE